MAVDTEMLQWLGPEGQNLAKMEGWIEERKDGWVVCIYCVNVTGESRVVASPAFKTQAEAQAQLDKYDVVEKPEEAVKTAQKIIAPAPVAPPLPGAFVPFAQRPKVVLPTDEDQQTDETFRLLYHILNQRPEIVRARVLRFCIHAFARKGVTALQLARFDKAFASVMPKDLETPPTRPSEPPPGSHHE